MKLRSNPFLAISLALISASTLQAGVLFWDGADTTAAVPDANGGAGNWDTTLTNWNDAATGGIAAAWPSTGIDNDAVFGSTVGTVTVDAGGVTANDLTFNTVGYLINGGSLTLNGTTNILSTTTNSSTPITISAPLAGTSGFTKTGSGQLLLTGSNTGLSGIVTLPNVTGTNNAGLSLSGASSAGGITQIDINGTTGTDGQYLSLANVTLASTVTLNLSGQGGNSAPVGTLRASSAPAVVEGPVNILTPNVRISSSGAGSELRINGKIDDGVNSYGASFRFGDGNGVYLTNTANDWGGDTTFTGILRAEPGAIPATSRIIVGASGNGWFQTYGTLTRPLGNTAGSGAMDLSTNSANRILGFSARGGALAVNLGGAVSDMIWGTTVGFNPSIFGLNNSTADNAISLANPLDLNGANRVIQADANTATLTGGLKNSSVTAAGLRKLGTGTLAHDPGAVHAVSLQSVQTGAGTFEVKSGTLTVSTGAGTTYSVGMNGFTVVGGSTFRLTGGTVNASVSGSVFTAGHTTGGGGNFIQDGGTFDAGGREILNAYGATGTTTINGGTFICGQFRVGQATGTLNLNGGTLRTNNLSHNGTATTVNFNGGTLQARINSTSFVPTTLTNTVIRAGGAVIDSNGFNVTIAHALTEDGGSTGGGLTKNGTGILDLTGVNTYTGVTTINAGTVSISSLEDGGVAGNLGAATSNAANIVFGGGALQFSAAAVASSNRNFTINAASSATFNVSNAAGALTMTATVPTTTGFLYKTGVGEMTLDPGNSASMSLGALSANGGKLILKSGTINTTGEDPAVALYDLGAGARGGTLTIDGATLNVGGGKSLKPGANGNGNLDILSGEVTAPSVAIGHNGIVVATQSGGNVTTTNLYHQDAGAGSSYTLTDGTLTAQRIFNNTAGAHGFTLNLDGGTLKSAIGTTNLIDNQNVGTQIAVLLGDGNTIIDTTASNATIVRPMGDMPSVAGTFTKGGDNTLTLTGTNTYTGATSVTAGTLALVGGSQTSPITVASGAALGFTLGSPTTSTSSVTFSGLTAKVTVTGTPVAATLMTATSITGTPVLDPAIPGFELAIEGGGTLLNLKAVGATNIYNTWVSTNGLSGGDAAATADPDNDGLDNLIEFVIGGQPNLANPNSNSSDLAPTVSTDANNLIFTFRRTDLALTQPGIDIAVEYGSNLAGWTLASHGPGGVTVVITEDHYGAGIDRIVVTIPKVLATGAKIFARLNVEIP